MNRSFQYIDARRWTIMVFATISMLVLFVVLVNIIVDTYGIFRDDFTHQEQEPNKNFVKIKFLLKNPDKYDSFLFGSSRVNGIDIKKIRTGRFYNMEYSEGVPQEHLENIAFLLKNGVHIRTLLVGLDDFSYRVPPQKHLSDLLRQPYPDISGKSWTTFYTEYYVNLKRFVSTIKDLYQKVKAIHRKSGASGSDEAMIISHDIYDSGRVLCRNCDDEIDRAPDKHRSDPKFDKPFHYDGNNLENALGSIKDLVTLARKNNITLVVFMNPIHQTTYLDTEMALMMRFKRELAAITDYYDFSGLNSITTDNYYYHETSHYREMVGNMMLRRMFGHPQVSVPSDFGVLVTSRNIGAHLRTLQAQIRSRQAQQTGLRLIPSLS